MSDLNITLLTGIARSGTSITAKMFKESGAFGGVIRGEDNWGFCENDKIISTCILPYLKKFVYNYMEVEREIGGVNKKVKVINWKRVKVPFKKEFDFYQPIYFRKLVLGILEREGWDGESPVYIKAPSLCLMSPVWHEAFPEANWIIIRRNMHDILKSVSSPEWFHRDGKNKGRTALALNDETINRPNSMAEAYSVALKAIVNHPDISSHEVHYEDIMSGDFSGIKAGIELCGLDYDEEKLRGFVKKKQSIKETT
jgi:hypothetical protein